MLGSTNKGTGILYSAITFGRYRSAIVTLGMWNINRKLIYKGQTKAASPRAYRIRNSPHQSVSKMDSHALTRKAFPHQLQDMDLNTIARRRSPNDNSSETEKKIIPNCSPSTQKDNRLNEHIESLFKLSKNKIMDKQVLIADTAMQILKPVLIVKQYIPTKSIRIYNTT